MPIIREIIVDLIMIIIIIFFSSPLAIVSSIQQFLALSWVQNTVGAIVTLTGALGNLFFQYLPTLLLLIVTSIMPTIISVITSAQGQKTATQNWRTMLKRFYTYLVISTLILPTMLLSSISGLVNYFLAFSNFWQAISLLFVPSSGTFFINFLIQQAMLKNTLALIRVDMLVYYPIKTRFSQYTKWYIYYGLCCFMPWCYHRHDKNIGNRFLSPQQRLYAAEFWWIPLFTEWELPYILGASSMALVYSVFSPIILLAALLYFLFKFYLDRYVICYQHGHRIKQPYQKSADFIALRKNVFVIVRIVLGIALMFSVYLSFFFGTKIAGNAQFIIHVVFSAIFAVLCIIALIVFDIMARRWLNSSKHLVKREALKSDKVEEVATEMQEVPISLDAVRTNKCRYYDPPVLFEILSSTIMDKAQQQQQQAATAYTENEVETINESTYGNMSAITPIG
jgi:hypothetical protein